MKPGMPYLATRGATARRGHHRRTARRGGLCVREDGKCWRSKHVQARWQQRTTQQCIVPLGAIGAGPHTLTVEVGSAGGVKLFGIYVQQVPSM